MNQPGAVDGINGRAQVAQHRDHPVQRQRSLVDIAGEAVPSGPFGDEVQLVVEFTTITHHRQMGMAEIGKHRGGLQKVLTQRGIFGGGGEHQGECHLPAEARIEGMIDGGGVIRRQFFQ